MHQLPPERFLMQHSDCRIPQLWIYLLTVRKHLFQHCSQLLPPGLHNCSAYCLHCHLFHQKQQQPWKLHQHLSLHFLHLYLPDLSALPELQQYLLHHQQPPDMILHSLQISLLRLHSYSDHSMYFHPGLLPFSQTHQAYLLLL